MSEEYILRTSNLTKKYKDFKAVNEVNINIKKGDIYGFVGKNGAGKSTCMKMFSGLIHKTSGNIELFGYKDNEIIRNNAFKRIGSLIESPGMYPGMTGYENLKLISYEYPGITKNEIYELLEFVGLGKAADRKAKGYSLGMKQRLGIAIALMGNPEFLILDEPINGLDPQGIAEIRDLIERLNREKGMTIMISSHILDELEKLVTSIGIIHNGQMMNEFGKEEFAKMNSNHIELCTPDVDKAIDTVKQKCNCKCELSQEGALIISDYKVRFGDIINALVHNNVFINSIIENNLSLEQYYLTVTSH